MRSGTSVGANVAEAEQTQSNNFPFLTFNLIFAHVAESADAPDLESGGFTVGVQISSCAPCCGEPWDLPLIFLQIIFIQAVFSVIINIKA